MTEKKKTLLLTVGVLFSIGLIVVVVFLVREQQESEPLPSPQSSPEIPRVLEVGESTNACRLEFLVEDASPSPSPSASPSPSISPSPSPSPSPSTSPSPSPSDTPSPSDSPSPTPTPSASAASPAPSELPEAGIMTFTTGTVGAGALLLLLGMLGLLLL